MFYVGEMILWCGWFKYLYICNEWYFVFLLYGLFFLNGNINFG